MARWIDADGLRAKIAGYKVLCETPGEHLLVRLIEGAIAECIEEAEKEQGNANKISKR